MNIESCVAEGFLKKVKSSKEIQKKEFASAEYDLKRAESSSEDGDYKWSIIQSYYAIFHSARALLDRFGYRERKHFAIGVVLEDFANKKKIDMKLISDFHAAMSAREDADYRDVYSKETSDYLIEISWEFVDKIKEVMAHDENKNDKQKGKKKDEEDGNDA